MLNKINRQWCVAAKPLGAVKESDFCLKESATPNINADEFLVRSKYLSVAPVMRRYMIDGAGIEKPLDIGDVMIGRGVGEIIKSNNPSWPVGTIVQGKLGWQDLSVHNGAADSLMFKVVQRAVPISTALGVLGMTGFTAYCALKDIGKPKKGEVAVVSGAMGGVGTIAVQVARLMGCRVIGIAGGAQKCAMLKDKLGVDDTIDYKTEDVSKALSTIAPEGVDIFFDNVGGSILDGVLEHINRGARVISCGRISQYLTDKPYALKNWHAIGANRAVMQGFFVYDYHPMFAEAEHVMAGWIEKGALTYQEDVLEGLQAMPKALIRLYEGKNIGKQVVSIA